MYVRWMSTVQTKLVNWLTCWSHLSRLTFDQHRTLDQAIAWSWIVSVVFFFTLPENIGEGAVSIYRTMAGNLLRALHCNGSEWGSKFHAMSTHRLLRSFQIIFYYRACNCADILSLSLLCKHFDNFWRDYKIILLIMAAWLQSLGW